jgi:hypothetical protein
LISFDVIALFTEVPIKETLQLMEENFKAGILHLFTQTLTSKYFILNGKCYQQKEAVAMGSPLAPTVANYSYFMKILEIKH